MTMAAMHMALKKVCATVVSGGNAPPAPEPSEHAFDQVAPFVEVDIEGEWKYVRREIILIERLDDSTANQPSIVIRPSATHESKSALPNPV